MKRGQRGVALIKAMLVVALATSVAVAMVARQQFDVRRTANVIDAGQVALYGDGVEAWAGELLRRDKEDNKVDHLNEAWATILPPIPVEGGSVSGQISELQGRFNLNSLRTADGKQDSEALERFRRLIAAVQETAARNGQGEVAQKLDPRLAQVIADWLDADVEVSYPDGAEDDSYSVLERPYRTANGPMLDPSELLLLQGVDHDVFEALRPHVATLPIGVTLNINTASAEVLMSIAEGITLADAESLIEGRGEEGYETVKDFVTEPALAGRKFDEELLGVSSDYFLLSSQVQFGTLTQQRYSVLQRNEGGECRIVMRAQGSY